MTLHAHLLVTGLHNDPQASTKLIDSYSQMGSLPFSTLVFNSFQNPDPFMWAVLIKSHLWSHSFREAISLYHRMVCHHHHHVTNFIFPSVLRACAALGDLGIGSKLHSRILKSGFYGDPVIQTSLLGMYADLGCLADATKVFDDMPVRDVVSWSSIISGYVDNGEAGKALEMFRLLLVSQVSELDSVIMLSAAKACAELGSLRLARSLHGFLVTRNIPSCEALDNTLLEMYSSCGDSLSAWKIFANVPYRSVPLWTAMIFCFNQNGWFENSLQVFQLMLESNVQPNAITLMAVLNSCVGLGRLREGKSVHCYVVKRYVESEDHCLGPPLMELYSQSGTTRCCEEILHTIGERNVVSWNMLMSVYAQQGLFKEALAIFVQMQTHGLVPDSYSLSTAASACGDAGLLQLGNQIHGYVIARCFSDEFVLNSLIDMYCNCGSTDLAYSVFHKIRPKSIVTWNCMISGFSQNGESVEAVLLFDQIWLSELANVVYNSAA
ncbi:hypothetical protein Tsubulata_043497 [Turnera subulata]|uniref:Pentatricopeptide repeat-containing protein n=1 Tax=Turnera subulata TaxID=218843 RepID=A0A9Q0F7K1_9ROSI|nr:hypothetical protein Tsubulata_043497 [Turnera subulata]